MCVSCVYMLSVYSMNKDVYIYYYIITMSTHHDHRRRSSVNFGGKTFLPENICIKINKMPEFYMIFVRKIFFRFFFFWGGGGGGGGTCPLPPSPTPMIMAL